MQRFLCGLFLAICYGLVLFLFTGCQVDVSGSVGYKAFYPDKGGSKDKDIGDPRKGMYDGSGFGESHTSGGTSGTTEHFRGLKGGN